MPIRNALFPAALIALIYWVGPARSEEIHANGFSFSDELGGFRLTGLSGSGSEGDPFVIFEEIIGDAAAVLVVRRQTDPSNRKRWADGAGRDVVYIRKVVRNLTDKDWVCFDVELRQEEGKPSGYYDGLSFDQVLRREGDVKADRFANKTRGFEPHDTIRFDKGQVPPGEVLRLSLPIADLTPIAEFFLLQMPGGGTLADPTNCGTLPVLSMAPPIGNES